MSKRLIFILALTLIVLVSVFVIWKQERAIAPVTPELVVTNTEPNNTQSNQDPYPQHIEVISGNTDEVWYNIPELGVRMKLNKEFAEELVYTSDGESVSFQKKSILAASSQCSVESADFGYLYKINGTISDADQNNRSGRGNNYFTSLVEFGMIMQFPNFFIVLSTDRADACWWGNSENKAAEEAARKMYNGSGHQSVYAAVKNRSIEVVNEKNNKVK